MAAIILPQRYSSQPPKSALLDSSHPALAGVSNAIIVYGDPYGWLQSNATAQLGSKISAPTLNGARGHSATYAGPALIFDGSTTYLDFGTANIPADEFTLLWGGVFDSLTGVRGIIDGSNGSTNGWSLFSSGTDIYLSGNHYGGDLLSSSWATGTFYHGAARNKSGVGKSIFRNGAKIADSATGLPSVSNPTSSFLVGQLRVSSPRFISARFSYLYLVDKYLSDRVISDIAVNPYSIFFPRRRILQLAVSAPPVSATIPVFMNHYRNQGIM